MLNRRNFLNYAAKAVGTTALLSALDNPAYALYQQTFGANDTINIGVIGLKGMGWSDLKAALKVPGVKLIALCDSDANVLDERMAELTALKVDAAKVKKYKDYRSLLDNKDIDAVIIGTPDHWHALMMIHAVQAGKDVYVEKPVGNSIIECSTMVAAQEKYNKVVQAGQWQRSQQHFKDAVDFVKTGQLGNIRTVKVWCYQGWMKPAPVVADTLPPAGVDYAMWLGPASKRAFNASRYHFNFRWFWDYAGGLMTDWGVHLLDYGLLGMDSPVPKTISALGGRFAYPDLYEETPDTLTTLYEFDKFNMVWDSAMGIDNGSYNRNHGIAYIGNNGTLILNRQGWEVIEEKASGQKVSKPFVKSSDNGLDMHMINFFKVVRSRKKEELNCSIQAAAHVATVAQMGNLAFRSGQKLSWDNSKHQFTDQQVNDQYLLAKYHNGYSLPKV
ncbi:Gfo/Idh/MocA family oxidoreductase [Pedobacter sp. MC2016-15]|uniref:Gfo/Idh/MocA family protein n=1 Tax=Pedobacter sp. MC2016-15 TaxID=2994473 RepID=UPI0022453EC5|nr:Gfo/Idh/MocA family oxidoreductase [Pedobacter sp. MC2016-15]MCX2477620.1 Gfo/Idh/MocA family oxidoreductase [Pedobacter sp. MC2016-15]